MAKAPDLASKFTSSRLDKQHVKAFADHISRVETSTGIKISDILVNGLPPFDDIPGVDYRRVPKAKLADLIGAILSDPTVNPNVIINGTPAVFNVRVLSGR